VLCATSYQFSYHSPSLLAASAILSALYSLSSRPEYTEVVARELKLRIQTVTHTATVRKSINYYLLQFSLKTIFEDF
jgi:hypothetical protein